VELLQNMVDSDNNMVNLYSSRLKEFRFDEKINETRDKLNQWRDECHKTIDEYYQRKLDELKEYETKYEEKKSQIQININQLNEEQNNDLRKPIINLIEQDLNDIEQTSLQIHLRSLIINENSISIEKKFHFQNVKSDSRTSFFYLPESSSAIASNERYLLMHQYPCLNLIDQDSKITKQNHWPYDWIRDMCWSNKLQFFIVITSNCIYFVNEKLQYFIPEQENIKQNWFSSTCSEEFLYLSTCEWGSSIFQLNLTSPIDIVEQWKTPLTCEDYEGINDIKYNNETLALMIKNPKENKKRMDLKSIKTFSTIWSLELSLGPNIRLFTCCPINFNEWLVIDGTNSHIYQITKDGKYQQNIPYPSIPYRANFFNSNILAISSEYDLNLYPISS
jgi:hypothetical protein